MPPQAAHAPAADPLLDAYRAATTAQRRAFWKHLTTTGDLLTEPRFEWADIERTLAEAARRHPGLPITLVTDRPAGPLSAGVPLARAVPPATGAPRVLVLALDSDADLLEALRACAADPHARYFPVLVFHPTARWFHRDPIARRVLLEEAAHPEPKFSLDDFETLLQALHTTRDLPGAFVEIGVYRGRSARCALRYLRDAGIERPAFLLDTFAGFDYDAARASGDALWLGTHADTSADFVRAQIAGLAPAQVIAADICADDLPPEADPIAVANIDVDLREAVLAAALKVAPRLVPGGVMLLEDPGHTPALGGALLALHEFLERPESAGLTPIHLRSGQTMLMRTGPVA